METTETDVIEDGSHDTITPQDLLDTVAEGAQLYSALTQSFIEHFEFYGMTLKEWATEMTIEFPDQLDQTSYRGVLIELANKTQRASNYYSVASSLAKSFGGGAEIKKSDVIAALVQTFSVQNKKRPASAVLERMADSYMKSTVSARIAATVVRDFWKQRLETLESVRRISEAIGMSLHVELKHTASYS